jgi:hypothetical protein
MREGHIQRKGHHDSFLCTCQCYGLAGGIEQEETSSGVVCTALTIASPIGVLFIVWIGWQPRTQLVACEFDEKGGDCIGVAIMLLEIDG